MAWLKRTRGLLRDFRISSRGNVAMMFGIALVPIMIAAGVGLDFARAAMVRSQMSDALDAASLAVGSTTGLDRDKAEQLAKKYFKANYQGDTTNGDPEVSIANDGGYTQGKVIVTARYSVPATLLKIIGQDNMAVSTTSTVVWGQSKMWVALVLDNSLSMNEGSPTTKIDALQAAAKKLLVKLKAASATPGDVKVGIVPFTHLVRVDAASNVNKSWIYWGEWEAQPPNALLDGTTDLVGPGDNCPFSTSSHGFRCQRTPTNNSGNTSNNKVPDSSTSYPGYICPGIDDGSKNSSRYDRYYNGCWTSVATGSTKQVSSGWYATCSGYVNCSCTGSYSSKTCNAKYYKHTWVPNAHSTWTGCIMDRAQDYDVANTAPVGSNTTGFPATNDQHCSGAKVTALEKDWTAADAWSTLDTQIDNMSPEYSTNQPIGVAHGMQMLTPGDPYGTSAVPANTARYIILFSDGLNTQNRWWDDLSQMATGSTRINNRMTLVCAAAKTAGITIYSVYVHIGGLADSAPMQNCASDTGKYYNLTSADQIDAAFQDIAQKITNVRVAQ